MRKPTILIALSAGVHCAPGGRESTCTLMRRNASSTIRLLDPEAAHNLVNSAPSVADTMAAQLEEFRRKTRRAGKAEVVITPRQAEQLQALGYVSSGSSKPESEEKERGADPKDKVQIANLLHQGLLEADEENYREAIPLFEQILKADPKIALANLQLGRAWNSLGDYNKALPWLQRAVELTPQSVEAHYELGAAFGEMGDYAGSAKQLEAAVAEDPSSDELHFYLGSAYEEIDRAGDAMKQYQAALDLNPDNYRANLLLGRMFAIQDRPKEAMPLLQRAVKLDPQSADAHKFLGNVYTVLGEEEKARQRRSRGTAVESDGRRTLRRMTAAQRPNRTRGSGPPVAVQRRVHALGHRLHIQVNIQEIADRLCGARWVTQHFSVSHTANRDVRPVLEPGDDSSHVIAEGRRSDSAASTSLDGSATLQHFILRGEYLGERSLHENQLVIPALRKRKKKLRNNFHGFSFGFVDAIRFFGQKFDRLPFAIAARIVDVRFAFPISEQRHATGS